MASQFAELYSKMTPSQRGTLVVLPLMVVVAFGILIYNGRSSSYTALSWGKVFTAEEMARAEQALLDANLTDFHSKGLRIFAPKSEVDRYNAALVEVGSLPDNWASEWQQQYEKSSMFSSAAQLKQNMEIARYKLIARMLGAVDGIERADVIPATSQVRRSFGERPRATATVTVRPKRGRELTSRQVQSLRAAAAGAIPDIDPADITVLDESTGIAYTGDEQSGPFDNGLLARIRSFETSHEANIRAQLDYIPEVNVSVHVDLENLKSYSEHSQRVDSKTVTLSSDTRSITRDSSNRTSAAEPGQRSNVPTQLVSQSGPTRTEAFADESTSENSVPTSVTTSEKEYLAAMPESVQVSITIPEDYYRKVVLLAGPPQGLAEQELQEFLAGQGAAFRSAVDAERTRIEASVKSQVLPLVPKGTPPESIVVSSVVRVPRELPETGLPVADRMVELVNQWGSALAIALFAAWALRLLSKSMPKSEASSSTALEETLQKLRMPPRESEEAVARKRELTPRDVLQETVRDNPEMAAAVLRKWIKTSK